MLLSLSLTVLFTRCEKEPEPTVEIQDDHFLNALIERGVDKDGDGIISSDEASRIHVLDLSSCGISELSGIEAFVKLDSLICSFNQLTSLDLSENKYIKYLRCDNNQLVNLDVSGKKYLFEMD